MLGHISVFVFDVILSKTEGGVVHVYFCFYLHNRAALYYFIYHILCYVFFHFCLSTELQHTYHIQLNMDDELQFAKTNSYCVICYSMMIH